MNPALEWATSLLPPWLAALWAVEQQRNGLLLLGAGLLVALVFRTPAKRTQTATPKPVPPLPAVGNRSPLARLFHRPEKPVTVGGVTFDRAWRHVGIVATTGARKSTLLALLADQLGVPCVIITGDHAPPLENWTRSVAGWVWHARGGIPWYPWGGPLELAVQRAEFMHPSTSADVGVGRAMFKAAARVAWAAADDRDEPRTLAQLRAALPTVVRGQTSAMMAENWTARLKELEDSLGSSLGTELDIVDKLRGGASVMISLNSFQDVANRKRFASIAVLEALRAADTLGNIGVIIDEVGLIGADLFSDAVRTFRVRKVTGLFASQVASDFPDAVRGNVNVWFLGQQSGGDRVSRQWSSDTTFGLIPPEAFGEHHLPHGKFFVVAGGRVQQATIPTWTSRWERFPLGSIGWIETPPPSSETPNRPSPALLVSETRGPGVARCEGPPPMPPHFRADKQLENIWAHHRFPQGMDGCYESTYHVNNRGRPSCSWKSDPDQPSRDWLTYALSLALEDARLMGLTTEERVGYLREIQMKMAAEVLTVEHECGNKLCDRLDHIRWESRGENVRLMWESRRKTARQTVSA